MRLLRTDIHTANAGLFSGRQSPNVTTACTGSRLNRSKSSYCGRNCSHRNFSNRHDRPGDSILLRPVLAKLRNALLLGLGVQRYPLQPNAFVPDIAQVEAQIDDHTRVLVINSPANPTGAVFGEEILRELLLLAQQYNLFILADEVYDELVFTSTPYRSFLQVAAHDPHRVIVVNSFSKTYAMTGWRVGYAICPEGLSVTLARLQEAFTSSPCAIAQKAAETALEGSQEIVTEMRETYRRRRDMCLIEAGSSD